MTRMMIAAAVAAAALMAGPADAQKKYAPGVTDSEIKIGQTMPYSGPASSYAAIAKAQAAFFTMVNEQGGVNGRRVNLISLDDGYAPPKTVEQIRRLVEQDNVAFIFQSLGTATNSAIQKYLNQKGVPQLFVATGASKFGEHETYKWTMGWQPDYRTEARIYAKYILQTKPNAKVAILWQNDDFGRDYLNGVKDVFGDKYKAQVVEASYEVSDPTVDSQVVTLQASGADAMITAATPKFAAQAIRKVYDIGWRPMHFMTNVSVSIASVFQPAGLDKSVGLITAAYEKDASDPKWKDDAGMNEWRAFMAKYMPGADLADLNYIYGFATGNTLLQVLKQCGDDLTRENILKQAASLKDFDAKVLLPGIRVNTSPTNYYPIRSMQLQKFNGKTWELFGDVIAG